MRNSKNKGAGFAFAPELSHAEILTNPILDIAARFWDEERYKAFKICYRSMRLIDDMIDDQKANGPVGAHKADLLKGRIEEWLEVVNAKTGSGPMQVDFIAAMHRFKIPIWPWKRLGAAMNFDLSHDGFSSFLEFIRYSKGAAVAPAAVFMHLCGIRKDAGGYRGPAFDVRKAARPLALFSYLVHTVRDFEKDQKAGLNNFPDDLVIKAGLTRGQLQDIANGSPVANEALGAFRSLMHSYHGFISYYQSKARGMIDETKGHLDARAQLSLEVIYGLYTQIFERIDIEDGAFSAKELNPTPQEIETKLASIIAAF